MSCLGLVAESSEGKPRKALFSSEVAMNTLKRFLV